MAEEAELVHELRMLAEGYRQAATDELLIEGEGTEDQRDMESMADAMDRAAAVIERVTAERDEEKRVLSAIPGLSGVLAGTHCIVPVEPTEAMEKNAALQAFMADWEDVTDDECVAIATIYAAMISEGRADQMSDIVERLRAKKWPATINAIDEAADEIERLRAANAKAEAENATLRTRLAEAEKVIEPFAKAAEIKLCGIWRDDENFGRTDASSRLTFGHLRAARKWKEAGNG